MATQDSPSFKSLGFSVVEVQTLIFTSASMRFDDFCVEWRLNTMKRHKVPKSYVNVWSFWKELKMQCKDIYLELTLYVKLRISNIITASAAESLFTVNQKKFRQINSLVFSLVNTLLSRNFCQNSVRENSRNFHTVCKDAHWKIFREISDMKWIHTTICAVPIWGLHALWVKERFGLVIFHWIMNSPKVFS